MRYTCIAMVALLLFLSGCDYFPIANHFVIRDGLAYGSQDHRFEFTNQDVLLIIEGYQTPNTFGWIMLSTAWVGFKVQIENRRGETVVVNPSNFLLETATKHKYVARPYQKTRSRGEVMSAPELQEYAREFRGVDPLLPFDLKPQQKISGGIEFPRVSMSKDSMDYRLRFTVVSFPSREEIKFDIPLHLNKE